MTKTDAEYLRGIVEAPDDDRPRLEYADYLSTQQNPRAEFICIQCDLARRPPHGSEYWNLKERELDLLAAHGPDWRAPIRRISSWLDSVQLVFRRGFVEALGAGGGGCFGELGSELLKSIPTLRDLSIEMYDKTSTKKSVWEERGLAPPASKYEWTELAHCEQFRQIDELCISSNLLHGEPPTSAQLG